MAGTLFTVCWSTITSDGPFGGRWTLLEVNGAKWVENGSVVGGSGGCCVCTGWSGCTDLGEYLIGGVTTLICGLVDGRQFPGDRLSLETSVTFPFNTFVATWFSIPLLGNSPAKKKSKL